MFCSYIVIAKINFKNKIEDLKMKRLILLAVTLILGLNVAVFSQQTQQQAQPQKPAVTEQKKAEADTAKKAVKKEAKKAKKVKKEKKEKAPKPGN